MGETLTFTVKMDPVPKGRPRMTKTGHTYTPKETTIAEKHIKEFATLAMKDAGLTANNFPVSVLILFTFKQPKSNKTKFHIQRPDLDNCAKLVTDALNGIVYLDDSQIVILSVAKTWGAEGSIVICVADVDLDEPESTINQGEETVDKSDKKELKAKGEKAFVKMEQKDIKEAKKAKKGKK